MKQQDAKKRVFAAMTSNKLDDLESEHGTEPLSGRWNDQKTTWWLFPYKNCLWDFKTCEFREADPSEMVHNTTRYHWSLDRAGVPEMPSEEAIRFVLDFFAGIVLDENELKYILMLCAASMEGRNRFGEFYLLVGDGANGKGSLFKLLRQIFGKQGEGGIYAVCSPEKFQNPPKADTSGSTEDLMAIQTARLVCAAEGSTVKKYNVQMFKQFTGDDEMTGRKNHGSQLAFKPQFTPWNQINKFSGLPLAMALGVAT
eukprot:SAG22_NODE_851_length_6849_cov_37.382519_3_plen_256_part_00